MRQSIWVVKSRKRGAPSSTVPMNFEKKVFFLEKKVETETEDSASEYMGGKVKSIRVVK